MRSPVVSHRPIGPDYFHLVLEAPGIAAEAKPGQFLMIRVATRQTDPLLRRPISIMDAQPPGTVELIYKVAGRGTRLLSEWADPFLDVIGPLGNSFLSHTEPHSAILVGGGIGIPPLIFLAHHLAGWKDIPVSVFLGGRTAADLPGIERFKGYGAEVTVATESGERGTKGMVTGPLVEWLNAEKPDKPVIYACGPDPMLRAIASLSRQRAIPARLSLEEHMGCGVGACLGCVVETRDGYRRVCADGPVFDADILRKWK